MTGDTKGTGPGYLEPHPLRGAGVRRDRHLEHGSVPTSCPTMPEPSQPWGGLCSRGQGQKCHLASTLRPLAQDGGHRAACPVPLLCLKGARKAPALHHAHRGQGQGRVESWQWPPAPRRSLE